MYFDFIPPIFFLFWLSVSLMLINSNAGEKKWDEDSHG